MVGGVAILVIRKDPVKNLDIIPHGQNFVVPIGYDALSS
jgi:hypothetical protein